jgi:hypothetical protein
MNYQDLIYRIFILAALVIGLIYYQKSNLPFRILTLYLGYTFLSECLSLYFRNSLHNNSLVQKIFLLVEIASVGLIYYLLFEIKLYKIVTQFITVCFFLFSLIFIFLYPEPILPSYLVAAEALFFIFFSLLFYRQLLVFPKEKDLLVSGAFWLNSSLLINSAGSFVFWITFRYLWNHHILFPNLLNILFALQLIEYTILGVALYLHGQQKFGEESNHERTLSYYK